MKAYINRKNGKFKIHKLEFDHLEILCEAFKVFESHLDILCETLQKTTYYQDWSMCHMMRRGLFAQREKYVQNYYSVAYQLHELFVFYNVLQYLQKNGNDYERSIARSLIMLVHQHLPKTETTRQVEIYSEL